MSTFRVGRTVFGKARKLTSLAIGDVLLYEYDFGSTTEIVLTVADEILRAKQKEKVQLLARNVPSEKKCDGCSAPATYVDIINGDNLCDECAKNSNDDEMLMLITNSPRSGECGYDGELDIWRFDPTKPFPQPQKRKTKRGGVWMPPEEA